MPPHGCPLVPLPSWESFLLLVCCFMSNPIVLLLTLTTLTSHPQAPIDLWSQFRGPNGSGVAKDCQPPVVIDAEKATWKVDVPPGHSSPVAV